MCKETYSDLSELDMGSLEPTTLTIVAKNLQIDHSEFTWDYQNRPYLLI